MVLDTVITTFSPAFNRSIAWLIESWAFKDNSIWSIRLCMIEPKFALWTVVFSPWMAALDPLVSKDFCRSLTITSFSREKARMSRMDVAMSSAVALLTLASWVLYATPAKVRSRRMYWPTFVSILATVCCIGMPPALIASESWVMLSTASLISVLEYKSITSGRLAYVADEKNVPNAFLTNSRTNPDRPWPMLTPASFSALPGSTPAPPALWLSSKIM